MRLLGKMTEVCGGIYEPSGQNRFQTVQFTRMPGTSAVAGVSAEPPSHRSPSICRSTHVPRRFPLRRPGLVQRVTSQSAGPPNSGQGTTNRTNRHEQKNFWGYFPALGGSARIRSLGAAGRRLRPATGGAAGKLWHNCKKMRRGGTNINLLKFQMDFRVEIR